MTTQLTPQIAAMYLGQKFELVKSPKHWDEEDKHSIGRVVGPQTILFMRSYSGIEISLHLRPLSSITEAESREIISMHIGRPFEPGHDNLYDLNVGESTMMMDIIGSPAVWLRLLSWGIDLFGGIEAGWAKPLETNEQ